MFDVLGKLIEKGIGGILKTGEGASKAILVASGSGAQSISEQLANQEINPICIIERSLMEIKEVDNLLAYSLMTFSSQYISLFQRLYADGDAAQSARVTSLLDRMGTDRSLDRLLVSATESYSYGLPNYASHDAMTGYITTPELESVDWDSVNRGIEDGVALESSKDDKKNKDGRVEPFGSNIGQVSTTGIVVRMNLRTGKNDPSDGSIPVDLRFKYNSYWASSLLIEDIVKANLANLSLKSRIQMYNFGEITFKELLTGSDIVKRQERVRKENNHELLQSVFDSRAMDVTYTLATGKAPINRACAVVVLSQNTVTRLRNTIGGDLDKYKVRQRFFESTAAQTIIVVDEEHEMVTIYYRGIKNGTTFPLRRLKKEKAVGEDLLPLIKALSDGNAPRY